MRLTRSRKSVQPASCLGAKGAGVPVIAYQFQVDGRAAAPIREKWRIAAQDAVSAGYASWTRKGTAIKLSAGQGAEIARVKIGGNQV